MARNKLIKFFRGAEASLPSLNEGEPGFCTDTGKLYIGSANGNVEIGADDGGAPLTVTTAAYGITNTGSYVGSVSTETVSTGGSGSLTTGTGGTGATGAPSGTVNVVTGTLSGTTLTLVSTTAVATGTHTHTGPSHSHTVSSHVHDYTRTVQTSSGTFSKQNVVTSVS